MPRHTTWVRVDIGYLLNAKTLSMRIPEAKLGFLCFVLWVRLQGLPEEGVPIGDLTPHVLS